MIIYNEYDIVRNRIDEILGFCEDVEGSDVTLFLEGEFAYYPVVMLYFSFFVLGPKSYTWKI